MHLLNRLFPAAKLYTFIKINNFVKPQPDRLWDRLGLQERPLDALIGRNLLTASLISCENGDTLSGAPSSGETSP